MDLVFSAEAAENGEHAAEEALQLVEANEAQIAAALIVLLAPLIGFLLTGLVGRRPVQRQALLHWAYDSREL